MLKEEISAGIYQNFGFRQIKILDGNIGYINLTGFHDLQYAAETINGAMKFLDNTKALIIDLRNCQGGSSDTAQYLSSFFFSETPVLLYDFYTRDAENTMHNQYLTFPYINGRHRPAVDLYILTSSFAFSAPEGFAYALQSLKRATIIGESTGGGANMWIGKIATDRFYVHIPNAHPIDPRTKTNWEGTGVKPDIEVRAKDALLTAHIKALEKLASSSDKDARYNWYLSAARAQLNNVVVKEATLKFYAGKYSDKTIALENGKLYFHWRGIDCELIPMTETLFRIEEFSFFRVEIILENGTVKGIKILNDDGSSRIFPKEN